MLLALNSSIWSGALVTALIVAGVNAAFSFFRKRFPAKPLPKREWSEPMPSSWTAISGLVMLAVAVTTVLGVAFASQWASKRLADPSGTARYVLVPTAAWWFLYSGFLGLASVYAFSKPILERIMGPEDIALALCRNRVLRHGRPSPWANRESNQTTVKAPLRLTRIVYRIRNK